MSTALMEEIKDVRKDFAKFRDVMRKANRPRRRNQVHFGTDEPSRSRDEEGMMGFKSLGHFAHTVETHSREQSLGVLETKLTPRYQKYFTPDGLKAATGQNEALLSEGAVLIPPEFANQILERIQEGIDLAAMTDAYTVSGNTMNFPAIDEDSRLDGFRDGGFLAYWDNEGQQITSSKIKFKNLELKLRRLTAMGFTTEELRSDSSLAMEQFLTRKAGDAISFKVGDAITNGDGTDRPLGYLQSPARVTVAKEGSQLADTILHANIIKMFARMPVSSLGSAVWFINQDTLPALWSMFLATGTTGQAVLLPPGGISGSPYMTLLGRPIIPTEWSSTLGTEGDISFVDLGQYITIGKGAIDQAMSIHLRFDYNEEAFRFIFRIDGRPWQNAPLTPFKGTATQSAIVTLATRA